MKKILMILGIATLFTVACTNKPVSTQEPEYRCQWCNDTLCVTGWCGCDSVQNCQTEAITCDSLLQVDSLYYRELIDAINGE